MKEQNRRQELVGKRMKTEQELRTLQEPELGWELELGQLQELELGTLQEPELEQELALQVERMMQEQALPQQWDCKMKDPVEMRKMVRTKCTDFELRSKPVETLAEEHRM